ncbi:MAG: copper chaperone PCu(A)C [Gemmatimonadetes bacterium]|nr:copper chaperone PCu(A)C [Gemmatimonadota bacterium]
MRVRVALATALLGTACARGGDSASDAAADSSGATGPLRVRDGWARAADSGATGGAYLVLENRDSVAVSLAGVTTDAATAAEVHETMVHDGVAHMMPQDTVAIAPGATLTMAPGGLHLMLVGMRRAVAGGDTVDVVLRLVRGAGAPDSLPVRLPVRAP